MTQSSKASATSDPSARAIADEAPIGIFRADPAGLMLYINPALERISGVKSRRALGASWLRSAPAESRDRAEQEWQAAIAAGRNLETEFRFKHPDGSIRFANIVMAAERGADGAVSGFTGFVTDTSDQRASQEQLRKSERLFRLLAENATDIIVRLDLDDHVTYASPAMEEVTGFSAEETRGINPVSFMHPDDADAAREISRQLKAGEIEQAVIEYRTPHKDGHYIWAEARSRLVRNSRGEPQEVISVVRNISEHKKLQADLIAAREAERQASAAQSRFLAAMSHEIRTPISGVIGMIDLLINAPPDDQDRPRYRTALAASARTLLRVVDDVLDYSRLSEVGITLETAPFDVFAMAHAVIDLYRPAAEAKGLTLGLQFQAPARFAVGDPTRISQILGNLVSNAIKFTEQGRIDVAVEQRGESWIIAVSDSGIGLSADQQQRLFQAFAQADDTITARFGGTGLGLTIARLIVEAMNGSIRVESIAGNGATFTVTIPLQSTAAEAASPSSPETEATDGRKLRLLVADDNDVNLLYLTRVLERLGHQVTAVGDGQQALDAARSTPFDVIFLDRHMPHMDGEVAARELRLLRSDRQPLLVLVSAATSTRNISADPVLGALFDTSVPKPVRPEQIEAVLATISGRLQPVGDSIAETLGVDAARELNGLFRQDIEARLPAIHSALASDDAAALRHHAHAIGGAAYLIGEQGIGEAANNVETAPPTKLTKHAGHLCDVCVDYLAVNPVEVAALPGSHR